MGIRAIIFALAGLAFTAAPALGQRVEFERKLDVTGTITLDVSTIRGKIEVSPGDAGRVVVGGAATVRIGLTVPTNALELAKQFAANPAIEQRGQTVRLRPPTEEAQRNAITVNYRVTVPPQTNVVAVSDSGATMIRGVAGPVNVRTQSAEISVAEIGGATEVATGSGAVAIDRVAGPTTVSTNSSAIRARGLGGDVRVRTESGAVETNLTGPGSVDIETGSSEIRIEGAQGDVRTLTRSGRTIVRGAPNAAWDISSGSGSVEATVQATTGFRLEATTGSGSVTLTGASVDGSTAKRRIAGAVQGGGPTLKINSRSGSIAVTVPRGVRFDSDPLPPRGQTGV